MEKPPEVLARCLAIPRLVSAADDDVQAGPTPLAEIVSEPDLRSPAEARAYLTYKLETVGGSTSSRGLIFSGAIQSPVAQNAVANLFRGGVTSSLRASLTYDTRDNRLFASRGLYDNFFIEVADKFTGSENVFVRYGGFARFFKPLIGPFVLKTNLEIGIITSRLV